MDIPKLANGRGRRRWLSLLAVGGTVLAGSLAMRSSSDHRTAELDRDVTWITTVERGPMTIEVRAPGRLVPESERWLAAPAAGVVERLAVVPGDAVATGQVLVELSNPELDRQLLEAQLLLRSERASAAALESRLDNELLDLEASVAALDAELLDAELRLDADERLARDGVQSSVELQIRRNRVDALRRQRDIERRRHERRRASIPIQLSAQNARADMAASMRAYVAREVASLQVVAVSPGIVTSLRPLVGERVDRGDALAHMIDATRLRADLEVPQVRARDITLGQTALIDTRNNKVRGVVRRIDPSVHDGVVRVEVELTDPLPPDARAELRVDGTIQIEHLGETLFSRRPQSAREGDSIELYRFTSDDEASRVTVELGRLSVNTVQILAGLDEGDRIILSDTASIGDATHLRLR